jgi:ATP-dependent DNA helicase RecQ
MLIYVPPTESGDLVKNFAEKLSRTLNIPIYHGLVKTAQTKPQKELENWLLKKENVEGKYSYQNPMELNGKSIVLFDDICDSGATLKEIGKLLSSHGAKQVAPLVIAKTVGGDI